MEKKKVFNPLPAELRKLGLNKKEADVYLFLLEKDSAAVLEISRETSLSRPTVYRVIQSLIRKELILKGKENKKSYFSADSPDSFLKILRVKRRQAEEQEREFLRIISILQTKYYSRSGENEIKVYQKKTMLEELSRTGERNICVFCPEAELIDCQKIAKTYILIRKRLGKIFVKELVVGGKSVPVLSFVQRKKIQAFGKEWPGALVIADKVFIINKKQALCIEEKSTVKTIKLFFELLWQNIR